MHINRRAEAILDGMVREADLLRIRVARGALGERIIDVGAQSEGGIEAGRLTACVALGGLASVSVRADGAPDASTLHVEVRTSQPALACLGSQYAGWHLSRDGYSALASGPARAAFAHEAVFKQIAYRESPETAVLVLEAESAPPTDIVKDVADSCRVAPDKLSIVLAPTHSLAGAVQVAARALENALSKARRAEFQLSRIIEGIGSAPLAPPHPDPARAMARCNDRLIYESHVYLWVRGDEQDVDRLARRLPSSTSTLFGQPFSDALSDANGNFAHVDPELFGPASATVFALDCGRTFTTGSTPLPPSGASA